MTIDVLQSQWPLYKWFASVNDPRIYGTLMAQTDPRNMLVTGTPRPKLTTEVSAIKLIIKKKAKDIFKINLRDKAVKASLAFLTAVQPDLE